MQILLRAFFQFKIEYSIVFCTNSYGMSKLSLKNGIENHICLAATEA